MTEDAQIGQYLDRDATMAMEAVVDAVQLARTIEHDAVIGPLTKADASPVTIADFSVQAVVASRLSRDFPDDALVAEEDASGLRTVDAGSLSSRVVELVQRVDPGMHAEGVFGSNTHVRIVSVHR